MAENDSNPLKGKFDLGLPEDKSRREYEVGEVVWVRHGMMGAFQWWVKGEVVGWTWWRDTPQVWYKLRILGWAQDYRPPYRERYGERYWSYEAAPERPCEPKEEPWPYDNGPVWPEPQIYLLAQPRQMIPDAEFEHYGQEEAAK